MWRGAACLEAREHTRAKRWLQLANVCSFRNAELHYLLARCHRRLEEFSKAEFHLSRAHQLGWDVGQLEREQWLALAQTGRYDRIKRHWPTLFQNPGSDGPEICEAYVTAAFGLFRIDNALKVLDAWEQDYPGDPKPYIMRARLAKEQHWWGKVVTYCREARKRAPNRTDIQMELARGLMKQGQNDEAEELLRGIIEEEPSNLPAYLLYAEHMMKLGKNDEARKSLQHILREEPNNVDALLKLSNLALTLGLPEKALPLLERAVQLRPEYFEVAYAYGRALQVAGRSAEAESHFKFVGEATAQLGRRRRLIDHVFEEPDNLDLRFEVGFLSWRYESREDGEIWWRCILAIDPSYQPAHAALAHHYALAGDDTRAAHHREQAGTETGTIAADEKVQTILAGILSDSRRRVQPPSPGTTPDSQFDSVLREEWTTVSANATAAQEPNTLSRKQALPRTKTNASFADMAYQAGVEFVPRDGQEANQGTILETLGVGVALFDYDGDQDLDMFIPGGGFFDDHPAVLGLPPALFRNDGRWRFTELTQQAGLAEAPFYSHAAVVGDYNNDGMPDLLVTGYGGLLLYRNNGDGTFSNVLAETGLTHSLWNAGAAWGDVNADGNMDLYLVSYVNWSFEITPYRSPSQEKREPGAPEDFGPISDAFFLSNGDGTFRDATDEVGLIEGGKGLSVLAADFDLDNDLDYYVTNDTTPNLLYRNDGKGRLEEIGILSGAALGETGGSDGSMGVDLGDFDLDGRPDLWVANFERQSFALYHNLGDCVFQHSSASTGISATHGAFVGFGTVFFDMDRDGDEDLFVSTGHVMYNSPNAPYRQFPLLFENLGAERFVNVAPDAGPYTRTPHVGRGVAMGDVDLDGDVDLVVAHTNDPIALLDNLSKNDGNWLKIRLIGVTCNRDCIGARVRIEAGGRPQTRQIKGGSSYFSSHDPALFFGLGQADTIDRVEIVWPTGRKQTLSNIKSGQTLIVQEQPFTVTRVSSIASER